MHGPRVDVNARHKGVKEHDDDHDVGHVVPFDLKKECKRDLECRASTATAFLILEMKLLPAISMLRLLS